MTPSEVIEELERLCPECLTGELPTEVPINVGSPEEGQKVEEVVEEAGNVDVVEEEGESINSVNVTTSTSVPVKDDVTLNQRMGEHMHLDLAGERGAFPDPRKEKELTQNFRELVSKSRTRIGEKKRVNKCEGPFGCSGGINN